jgi:hypothetical protein
MSRSMRHGDRLIDYSTDWVADGVFPTISPSIFPAEPTFKESCQSALPAVTCD